MRHLLWYKILAADFLFTEEDPHKTMLLASTYMYL